MEQKASPEEEEGEAPPTPVAGEGVIIEERDDVLYELIEQIEIIRQQLSQANVGQVALLFPFAVLSIPAAYRFLVRPTFFLLFSSRMEYVRLPIIFLLYLFRRNIILLLIRFCEILSRALSEFVHLRSPLDRIASRRTHENPAENLGFAWTYIRDSVQSCISRSTQLIEDMRDPSITTGEIIGDLEKVRIAIQTLWEDSHSRLLHGLQIFRELGHVEEGEYQNIRKFMKAVITNRVRILLNKILKVTLILKARRNTQFANLLPMVNNDIQTVQRTLTHVLSRMNSVQNDVMSRARQLVPPSMRQTRITDEIRDFATDFIEATQAIRFKQRLDSLRKAIERRMELANNNWVSQSRQGNMNEAAQSYRLLQQLKSLSDQLINNEPLIEEINLSLQENNIEKASELQSVFNNTLKEIENKLSKLKQQIRHTHIKAVEDDLDKTINAFNSLKETISDRADELYKAAAEEGRRGNKQQQNELISVWQIMNILCMAFRTKASLITAAQRALQEGDQQSTSDAIEAINDFLNETQENYDICNSRCVDFKQ